MFSRIALALLASWSAGSPVVISAQEPAVHIQILATFDYPGGSMATVPSGINDRGDLAGWYIDSSGLQRGFVRYRNGNFSPPIVPPFEVGRNTAADNINNSETICGFFSSADDTVFHGYFLAGNAFTQFDIEGALSTFVVALNNAGGFAGSFDINPDTTLAFVTSGGVIDCFSIPGASFTGASSLTGSGATVGNYRIGTETANHGFIRDRAGNLTFPVDFPGPLGPTGTVLSGVNDSGWIVGTYYGLDSKEGGFLFRKANGFFAFDYPGALATSLAGISNTGLICGSYIDSLLLTRRGFIGRLR